jgi:hypothetical protein
MSMDPAHRCPHCRRSMPAEDQDDRKAHRPSCRRFAMGVGPNGGVYGLPAGPTRGEPGMTMSDPDAYRGKPATVRWPAVGRAPEEGR